MSDEILNISVNVGGKESSMNERISKKLPIKKEKDESDE